MHRASGDRDKVGGYGDDARIGKGYGNVMGKRNTLTVAHGRNGPCYPGLSFYHAFFSDND
ncbi:MAG: hypothetical protein WB792_08925 [Desulfobacterales bacterium]